MPGGLFMQADFTNALICNFVSEKTKAEGGQLVRQVQILDNAHSLAQFFGGQSTPLQSQEWSTVRKNPITEVRKSTFSYRFKPGYAVFIVGTDGQKSRLISDEFVDKEVYFK